ncbi:hypothetical protein PIB30_045814, partial [Stylosanthes scabra]|nr:hypothetical protein [Stylosanthes scabra]
PPSAAALPSTTINVNTCNATLRRHPHRYPQPPTLTHSQSLSLSADTPSSLGSPSSPLTASRRCRHLQYILCKSAIRELPHWPLFSSKHISFRLPAWHGHLVEGVCTAVARMGSKWFKKQL